MQTAIAFVQEHEDPFPECRADHLIEIGRRIGLGADDPEVLDQVPEALALVRDETELRWLGEGTARYLIDEDGSDRGLTKALRSMEPDLARALAHAAGRRAWTVDHVDPHLQDGACERRGEEEISLATGGGERRPVDLVYHPLDCGPSYWTGVGRGWARFVGCEGEPPDQALAGWRDACATLRR